MMRSLDSNARDRREKERFPFRLEICCRSVDLSDRTAWHGLALDLSGQGIRLAVERSFQAQTLLAIEFHEPDKLPLASLLVRVVWSEKDESGGWQIGCMLMHMLSDAEVAELVAKSKQGVAAEKVLADDRGAALRLGRVRPQVGPSSATTVVPTSESIDRFAQSPRKTNPDNPTALSPG